MSSMRRWPSYLAREGDLFTIFETCWTSRTVRVVEYDCNTGFGDSSLPTFVNKILLVLGTHLKRQSIEPCIEGWSRCSYLLHVSDTKDEAYGVQDITLP